MDQQNYELDQTGAEETPKKKKGSTFKGIVIGVIGTLLISWTGINVACLATNSQILITNKESADDGEGAVLDADTVGKIKQLCDLLLAEIQRIDQMTHGQYTSV